LAQREKTRPEKDSKGKRTLSRIGLAHRVRPAHRFSSARHAVLVTPLSGPLARFGRCGASALQLWAEHAGVALEVIEAYPSVAAAVVTAEAGRPDVLFGPYGTGPAVAAARASVGVVWNHGGATARLARPAYPLIVNVPSPAGTYLAAVLDTLVGDGLPAGSEIVLLYGATRFGREVADGAVVAAQRLGLVLHPVSFPPGEGPAAFEQAPGGDVLLSAGSFEDDIAIAALGLRRRWRAVGLVAAGVEEFAYTLGERVEGLYGPCQWLADTAPEPSDGPEADWFVSGYQQAAGTKPPYPAASAFAAGIIWDRCTHDAKSTDPLRVLAASWDLDTTTLFGRFRVDPLTGVQTGHQIRVVRWQHGRRVLVE
jgi:ABC-type branched-subunit amino acid transport system substrate-binding protein